jgi:transposase
VTKATRIGLDIAKQVFHVHGADQSGRAVLRRKLRRNEVARFFSEQPPCLVGIEAGGSAHCWARVLTGLGHTVRLMAPQFVKPYVKSQKNDANDTEAICSFPLLRQRMLLNTRRVHICPRKTPPFEAGVLSFLPRPGKLSRNPLEISACVVRLVPV